MTGMGGTATWCVTVTGAECQGSTSQPRATDEADVDVEAGRVGVDADEAGALPDGLGVPLDPHPAAAPTATASAHNATNRTRMSLPITLSLLTVVRADTLAPLGPLGQSRSSRWHGPTGAAYSGYRTGGRC